MQMDLLQPAQMVLLQSLMETRVLLLVLMVASQKLVLMEALLLEEDLEEDLMEDVPRKIESAVMDPHQSLMETEAPHPVLMEPSQSVLQMIVKS